MAEEKKAGGKSIEMRLAEIEDKLAKMHVTEEEMAAYNKVSGMLGAGGGASAEGAADCVSAAAPAPGICTVLQCIIPRQIHRFINRGITPRINRGECFECSCGPCLAGGGGVGGGFGGFGQ